MPVKIHSAKWDSGSNTQQGRPLAPALLQTTAKRASSQAAVRRNYNLVAHPSATQAASVCKEKHGAKSAPSHKQSMGKCYGGGETNNQRFGLTFSIQGQALSICINTLYIFIWHMSAWGTSSIWFLSPQLPCEPLEVLDLIFPELTQCRTQVDLKKYLVEIIKMLNTQL